MFKLKAHLAVLVIVASGSASLASSIDRQNESLKRFRNRVQPLIQKYCVGCHGETKPKADVRLDNLNPNIATGQDGETWHDALNKMHLGEMPPKKADQPSREDRQAIIEWLTAELKRATEERRSTGGRVVVRRLTRYEYANTMRDLLGLDVEYAKDLPAEPNSPDGFKNNGHSLGMSALQLEHYLRIARKVVAKVIVVGDQPETFEYNFKGNSVKAEGGTLHPPNTGTAVFKSYPHEGPFHVRIEASAPNLRPDQSATMQVLMGIRPSPKNLKFKTLAEARVKGGKEIQTFEFKGRIENFPLHDAVTPDKERRYPGLRIGFNDLSPYVPAAEEIGNDDDKKAKKKRSKKPRTNLVIHSVSFEAPVYQTWPPAAHTSILFESDLAKTNEREYARQVLSRFMQRAYRRPISHAEVNRKLLAFDQLRKVQPSFELAMREVLPEVLVSPDFLYMAEPVASDGKKSPLTQYELASRLSYFLWSTMPDSALFELASKNILRDPQTLERQVRTMLADDRSWQFVQQFTDQWLNLSGLTRVAVNPDYYPDFDNRLKADMRLETQHFFAEILRNDLSVFNLIDSDFTMLNRSLAAHYGLNGPVDETFVRVALKPEDHRGGLLAQGSVLLSNSSGDDSHPILRGVFIRDRLLGDTPASPPPDVPELDRGKAGFRSLSLKKQLELHRNTESCNSCHRNIDPWGVPLENYDAVGKWRTSVLRAEGTGEPAVFSNGVLKRGRKRPKFTNVPVEADSALPNGTTLDGPQALKAYLLKHERDRFVEAFVRRLLAYSLGRSLEIVDNETVKSLIHSFKRSGYQIDELIVAITKSEPFVTK